MKNLIILFSLFVCYNAPAQIIKSLYDDEYRALEEAYYKDTHNDLDKYTGTWKYTNGTTSLTISLQKKMMREAYNASHSKHFYEDILVGEYRYIENGIEKINTLSQLMLELPEIAEYNIFGNTIIGPQSIYCRDCNLNDRKILLIFSDPTCHIFGYDPEMIFQRADTGTIKKLKLKFRPTGSILVEEGVPLPCTEYKIPFGEYILTKIN